ncbi:MAG: glycosyltransferase family 4 protein [Anaerolineae bacterium]|nr:glycosyltransferase family 4 protein [Anaerolineae bacterium]
MRIGIDARMVYYTGAGIGQYIRRLVTGLAKVVTDDEIILLQSRKDEPVPVEGAPFSWRPLWTPGHNRWERWSLPLELMPLGLEVLHSPDHIPPMRHVCRSVVTVHDLAFLRFPHFLTHDSARYYGQIDAAMRKTDHVIAVSEATKQDLVLLLGVNANKITVIHEAADPSFHVIRGDAALAEMRHKYELPGPYILFVSTIEPRKNLPTLLQVFHDLRDMEVMEGSEGRGADVRVPLNLVIVGKRGWLDEDVFRVADELGLGDRARFLGRVPQEDLLRLYNGAAVFVQPSFYEGFGLPPLEALWCGAPVIVSDAASLPEVVGDAGLKVPPLDQALWAEALRLVLQNPDRRTGMVRRGLEQARRFSLDRMARETLEVYHKIGMLR